MLVDPTDPDAVARALNRVLADHVLGQRLADAGRERAEALSWSNVVERYAKVIDQVLQEPERKRSARSFGWIADLARGPRSVD